MLGYARGTVPAKSHDHGRANPTYEPYLDPTHGRTQAQDRHPHPGQQPGPQGRQRQAAQLRVRLRRGRSADRRVPPHGAGRRVRHLRDGDHHLYLRPRLRQADDGGAGVPGARLSSWRDPGQHQVRHPQPEGPRGQAGRRQPRLHGHHRGVGARHPAGGIRRRSRARSPGCSPATSTWPSTGRPPTWCRSSPARRWPTCWPRASSPPPSGSRSTPPTSSRSFPTRSRPGSRRCAGAASTRSIIRW